MIPDRTQVYYLANGPHPSHPPSTNPTTVTDGVHSANTSSNGLQEPDRGGQHKESCPIMSYKVKFWGVYLQDEVLLSVESMC